MKFLISSMMFLLACAVGYAGTELSKETREKLENALKTEDTIVIAKVDKYERGFAKTFLSGRPAGSEGPNGASYSGTVLRCEATVIKTVKGTLTTKKIKFDLQLTVDGTDTKVDNPFSIGKNYVLMFRRKHIPKDDTTLLAFDSWSVCPKGWPEESPEGTFILSKLKQVPAN